MAVFFHLTLVRVSCFTHIVIWNFILIITTITLAKRFELAHRSDACLIHVGKGGACIGQTFTELGPLFPLQLVGMIADHAGDR